MASVAALDQPEAPISLYLDLAPGRRGDLEVISRAAIAWVETIREAAFLADPFVEVRVEAVSGTEGSFSLNSALRAIKGVVTDRKRLKGILIGVALFFARDAWDFAKSKGYDAMWEWAKAEYGEEIGDLADEAKREVEEIVGKILQSKSAREKAQRVYRELQKDDAVIGVGVSFIPKKRPEQIVPRAEFADRGNAAAIEEETVQRRTQRDRIVLTLISPALSDDDLKWKFQLGTKTLWASIDHPEFEARLRPGSNSAPRMVTGIRMDVDIETVQEFRDNVWFNVDQRVTHVYSLSEPVEQPEWLSAPTKPPKP